MKAIARRPRVWLATIPMTGYLDGELADWPPAMQDAVYEAMEEVLNRTGVRELELVQCVCLKDAPDQPYHARITVMEKLGPQDVVIIQ